MWILVNRKWEEWGGHSLKHPEATLPLLLGIVNISTLFLPPPLCVTALKNCDRLTPIWLYSSNLGILQ